MEVFDLRAISSVAPMFDLKAGLIAVLVSVLVAHAIVIPKLSLRSALAFVAISLLGLLAVAVTLAVPPPSIYLACVIYVVAFVVWTGVVSRGSPNKFSASAAGYGQLAFHVVRRGVCMVAGVCAKVAA